MNKMFLRSVSKALIATVLVVVMWIFQYYPGVADFKFWLGLVVVVCILIYMVILVGQLAKKLSASQKELSICQKEQADCREELAQTAPEETKTE